MSYIVSLSVLNRTKTGQAVLELVNLASILYFVLSFYNIVSKHIALYKRVDVKKEQLVWSWPAVGLQHLLPLDLNKM